MSKRPTNDTVTMTGGVADTRPQSIAANEMWLKNRAVPVDYLESVLGNAGVTIRVHAAPLDAHVNGVKPE